MIAKKKELADPAAASSLPRPGKPPPGKLKTLLRTGQLRDEIFPQALARHLGALLFWSLRNGEDWGFDTRALATAWNSRLKGAAGVDVAIGQASHLGSTAEMELRHLRIADRPTAAALGQRLNAFALGQRDHQFFGR